MKSPLILLSLLILLGTGCRGQETTKQEEFKNKIICFEKAEEFANVNAREVIKQVFYNEKRNTCIIGQEELDFKENLAMFTIEDLFTGENIWVGIAKGTDEMKNKAQEYRQKLEELKGH